MGRKAVVGLSGQVSQALDHVIDPHFKVGLNEMGMVTNIIVDEKGAVEVGLRCPCIGCPAWRMMRDNVKASVAEIPGVRDVKIKVDWETPWNRDDMSDAAREKARTHGYVI